MLESTTGHAVAAVQGGADVNACTLDSRSSLPVGCHVGGLDAVKLLLEHGAKVAMYNTQGKTLLHIAAEAGRHLQKFRLSLPPSEAYEQIINILIDAGTDINSLGGVQTPLAIGAISGKEVVVRLLLRLDAHPMLYSSAITPLFAAAAGGHIELVRLFLNNGVHIDGPPGEGDWDPDFRATNIATELGHVDIVNLFLERGAKPADNG